MKQKLIPISRLVPKQQFLLKRPDLAKVLNLYVDPEALRIFSNSTLEGTNTMSKLLVCGLSALALLPAAENPPKSNPPDVPPTVATIANNGARQVEYGERDIVAVAAKTRFTTLIRLPKGEQILDFICGDKEFWQVSGVQNFAFVKPSKVGASTSLHLVTAAGTVYGFVLTEVGDTGRAPDLELDVSTKDTSLMSAINGDPKFVPAAAIEDFKAQYEMAKQNERIAKEQAQLQVFAANARAEAAKSRSSFGSEVQLSLREEQAAVPGGGHLSRRQIHLHPGYSAGDPGRLRTEGR